MIDPDGSARVGAGGIEVGIKAGIVGGTGYTGVELLRLLARHPEVELSAITSRGDAGRPVADMNLYCSFALDFDGTCVG